MAPLPPPGPDGLPPSGPPSAPPPAAPRPTPARRGLGPWGLGLPLVLALVLAAALAAALGLWRALHSEAGTRQILGWAQAGLPGLEIAQPRGPLLGPGPFRLARLQLEAGRWRVQIERLELAGLRLAPGGPGPAWLAVQLEHLQAGRFALQALAPAAPDEPPRPPLQSLELPLSLALARLQLDRIELPGLPAPLEALRLEGLKLGPEHRIEHLRARWRGLQVDGHLRLGAAAPLPLQAELRLAAAPAPAAAASAPASPTLLPPALQGLQAALQVDGPLAAPQARLGLRLADQAVQAQARLAPFAARPLDGLDATLERLDLAPLAALFGAQAPQTALSGTVQLDLREQATQRLQLALRNPAADRWDLGRLPLAQLDARLHGAGRAWTVESAELRFAGRPAEAAARAPAAEAGRLRLEGRFAWPETGLPQLDLRLTLDSLQLAALDRRAPPLRLAGPLSLQHALTDPSEAAGMAGRPAASAPQPAPVTPGASATPPRVSPAAVAWGPLLIEARLQGQVSGAGRERLPAALREAPVRMQLRLGARPGEITLHTLRAEAGGSRLEAEARLHGALAGGAAAQASRSSGRLTLAAFDPRLWLPGPPEAAWRRGRHALNGAADWALDAAAGAAPADPAAWRGRLQARLGDSQLASLPLSLALDLKVEPLAELAARLALAGNQLALDGRWPLPGATVDTEAAGLTLRLDAPALTALAPLGPGPAAQAPAGRLSGQMSFDRPQPGPRPWPGRSQGSLQAEGLRLVGLALAQLQARWDLQGLPGSPQAVAEARLDSLLSLSGLSLPALRVDSARFALQGRLAEHRAELAARLRPAASPAAEGAAPAEPVGPVQLDAVLAGRWTAAAEAGGRWLGQLAQLKLQPVAVPEAPPPRIAGPWLAAEGLQLQLDHGPDGWQARLAPGRLSLAGQALRWQQAEAAQAAGGGPPQIALEAALDALDVPALLARLQPEVGWGGDLRIGARVSLQTRGGIRLKAAVERQGGDLQISEFGLTERLQLQALRLAAEAEGGEWRFTQEIAGAGLGRIDGEQRLHLRDPAAWPGPQDKVYGALRLAVDSLAGWAAWVPPGWRLGGRLEAGLAISGALGGPELNGQLSGRELSLRQALEGVALREGSVDLSFDGRSGTLSRLRFAAGEGEIVATGDAIFGAAPEATVRLQARRAQLLGRVDRRLVVGGEAELRLDPQRLRLRGQLAAEDGLFDIRQAGAPKLGDDVRVIRRGAPPVAAARGPGRAMELDLRLSLGPRVLLRGRGIDTRLVGELRLSAPRGLLAAQGEIRTERGSYEAYGQKLSISRGVVSFAGDLANPRLDIEAVRAISDSTVGVRVGGSAQAPRVKLFSDPELPDTDKLALLVTGRRYDSLAGSETLLLQRAAVALLSGEGGSEFNLARSLRLDEFAVRQDETGTVRDTVVTVGKQLSERLYLGYERGLAAAAGRLQLIYRVAQRFTLRAQGGTDSALDLIWAWNWN
ncbi:translocation/assembly module TamB domain-containing protein [Aquariibacter albus]|uniref:Translocation/assembly module TamB domain-containing protein n=1 Tax=Aquariibacter albus TaxID=2759899 RepID=A0A839HIQ0_9BURK|nr:translocation/assembly module TamB domain-containing protein [Aquariibacter albus]MBB1160712.1 translocation/assembly module TamB domain-containing protein [Aquariibacter albus]